MSYACHVTLHGNAVHRSRFLASPTELRPDGAPVEASLSASFLGHELGGGAVPVVLRPSKRLLRRVEMARINASMSAALQAAREEAAREAGVELPPPSPTPPETPYWRTSNYPLM